MATTHLNERLMAGPARLGLETRGVFRRDALAALEEMPEGAGRLLIDLTHSTHVDSAGLGALMLVQRGAAERRQQVVLIAPSDQLRFLLALTKLIDLFEIQSEA